MSRNNNRFSQLNGFDVGSRYARRHPEMAENRGVPGTLYKGLSREFQNQKLNRGRKKH